MNILALSIYDEKESKREMGRGRGDIKKDESKFFFLDSYIANPRTLNISLCQQIYVLTYHSYLLNATPSSGRYWHMHLHLHPPQLLFPLISKDIIESGWA